jgi:hypothetical protein
MTGEAQFYAFLDSRQNLHTYSHASKFLSSMAGYNQAATEQIFELRIYLYGKDLLHTYRFLNETVSSNLHNKQFYYFGSKERVS